VAAAGAAIAIAVSAPEGRIGPKNHIQPTGRKLEPVGKMTRLGISFREFDWTGDSLPGTSVPYNVVATLYYPQISDGSIPKIPPPSAFVQVNGPVGGPSSLTVVAPVPVPEPATLTLVGSGLVLMIRRRYLKRNR